MRADAGPDLLRPFALVQEPAALLPRGRQAPEDAPAVRGVADPIDLRVAPDRGVVRVDENHLVVLVRPVLADPVRVQDLHVRIVLGGTLLRDSLNRLRHRDLDEPAAFRVSSAISQPPGFTDSPEGTTPDQGCRKRRAKARAVLKSLLAPRPRADPTAVASVDAVFV